MECKIASNSYLLLSLCHMSGKATSAINTFGMYKRSPNLLSRNVKKMFSCLSKANLMQTAFISPICCHYVYQNNVPLTFLIMKMILNWDKWNTYRPTCHMLNSSFLEKNWKTITSVFETNSHTRTLKFSPGLRYPMNLCKNKLLPPSFVFGPPIGHCALTVRVKWPKLTSVTGVIKLT